MVRAWSSSSRIQGKEEEREREVKTGVATACIVLVHEQDTSSGKLVMPIQADSLRSRKVALIQ